MPLFEIFPGKDGHLDNTDAEFVDVIHTCGGALGFLDNIGHVDYYPNGGTPMQPGCCCAAELAGASSQLTGPRAVVGLGMFHQIAPQTTRIYVEPAHEPGTLANLSAEACSHGRSYQFFAESIQSKDFVGLACESWEGFYNGSCADGATAVMGEHTPPR